MSWGLIGKVLAVAMCFSCALGIKPTSARADTVLVAVASNFVDALKAIAKGFEDESGHSVKISSGATGHLYAQIAHGAPFDVFLAADAERPGLLVEKDLAVAGSLFTYAQGQLVWWAPRAKGECQGPAPCIDKTTRTIAIANPKLAPYGRAAEQVLNRREDWATIESRLVYGQNIAQTYAMIATGNADAGLIARAQLDPEKNQQGLAKLVDPKLYDPIRQDAVLLQRAEANQAARAFLDYLKSASARRLIVEFGYIEGVAAR